MTLARFGLSTIVVALLASIAAADELSDFKRAFKKTRRPAEAQEERKAALAALVPVNGVETAEMLILGYRRIAEELEGAQKDRRKYLLRGRRDPTWVTRPKIEPLRDLQRSLLEVIEDRTDLLERTVLMSAAFSDDEIPYSLRLGIVRAALAGGWGIERSIHAAASELREDRLVPLYAEVFEHESGRSRSLPAEWLRWLRHPEAIVRESAAAAFASTGTALAIEPMIDRLDREQGRTLKRLVRSLQRLTGQAIGTSGDAWKRWLDDEGARYVDGSEPLGQGQPVEASADEATRYFGIPIEGRRIVFVFDRSLSMQRSMSGGKGSGPAKDGEVQRLARAQAELVRVLEHLGPATQFNIVLFAGSLQLFDDDLVAATPKTVEKAVAWIDEVDMELWTILYDALDRTFALAGLPVEDELWNSEIDTIYILTDGEPFQAGKPDSTDRILEDVARWNLRRRTVIHVIGLGTTIPEEFLSRLARENGGKFQVVTE